MGDRYPQMATRWEVSTRDGYGNRTFSTPVILYVRWEDRNDLQILFAGELQPSNAIVYTKEDINLGDYLALGDYTTTTDPLTLTNAYIVRDFKKMPSVDGREYLRKVML